jgi:hypothetical protein
MLSDLLAFDQQSADPGLLGSGTNGRRSAQSNVRKIVDTSNSGHFPICLPVQRWRRSPYLDTSGCPNLSQYRIIRVHDASPPKN